MITMKKRWLFLSFIAMCLLCEIKIYAKDSLNYVNTVKEKHTESPLLKIDLTVPGLSNTSFPELEKDINNDILHKVNSKIEEVTHESEQYYEAFMASHSKEDQFIPLEVLVTYDIKKENADVLSFELTLFKSFLSAQTEEYFYNIDLTTGKMLTLEDFFGPTYKEIINPQIKQQIAQREKHENQLFFHDENEFQSISDHQKFYLNEQNQIVIVFDKYDIAPGYMGFPEFIVDQETTSTH